MRWWFGDNGYVGYSNGVLVGAGAGLGGSGRPGKYAIAVAAGGALLFVIVAGVALTVTGCCG